MLLLCVFCVVFVVGLFFVFWVVVVLGVCFVFVVVFVLCVCIFVCVYVFGGFFLCGGLGCFCVCGLCWFVLVCVLVNAFLLV